MSEIISIRHMQQGPKNGLCSNAIGSGYNGINMIESKIFLSGGGDAKQSYELDKKFFQLLKNWKE